MLTLRMRFVCGHTWVLHSTSSSTCTYTVQRLISSKCAKRTIFYHITVIMQYCWDKTIARSGDMYRDDLGILSLVIKCFTPVQNFAIRISSVKTVTKCLRKLKVFEQIWYRCIIDFDVFTPCESHDSHLSKLFRKSCDIVSNPSLCTF